MYKRIKKLQGTNVPHLTVEFPDIDMNKYDRYDIHISATNQNLVAGPQLILQVKDANGWHELDNWTLLDGRAANGLNQITHYSAGGVHQFNPTLINGQGQVILGELVHYNGPGPWGTVLSYDNDDPTNVGIIADLTVSRNHDLSKTKVYGFSAFGPGPFGHLIWGDLTTNNPTGFRVRWSQNGDGQYVENITGWVDIWGYETEFSNFKDFTLTTSGSDNTNQTWRHVLGANTWNGNAGSNVRLTFKASGTSQLTVGKVYIGEKAASGDPYDTTAMTQLTFDNGASSSGSISAGASKMTDVVPFTLNPAKDYVVSHYITSGSHKYSNSNSDVHAYVASGDQASTLDATGTWYDIANGGSYGLQKIEW